MPDALAWSVLLVHLAATLFMVGLIWFVQVVHYPLKRAVGQEHFPSYHHDHVVLTGWVVGPPMLLEAGSALVLVLWPSTLIDPTWALVGLGLLLIVWAATAFFSIPAHDRLAKDFDPGVHRRLVRTNWIRTLAWSLRGILWLTIVGSLGPVTSA